MTTLLPARRSISFIVTSVGGIVLSIMLASLIISYNPTRLSWSINGYSIGISRSKQPTLDSINGNRTDFLIKSPEVSEQGQEIVNDSRFSSIAEVPAFAPSLSVYELQEVDNANSSGSVNGLDNAAIFGDDYEKNDSGIGGNSVGSLNQTASVAAVPSLPPTDHEISRFGSEAGVPAFAPALSVDELQEVEGSSKANVSSSSVFVDDSRKNSSEISSTSVASLDQAVTVAAFPSPQRDHDKTLLRSCDLYRGRWIYDPAGPLYTNSTCPILAQGQNCQGNGRPDKHYENWRWRPNQCEIPRFDGRRFLELMRGKTLAFIGDSLARNQMESLLCILWQTEVPINHGSHQMHKWQFQSTSTTIVRIWSAWLVHKTPRSVASASPRAVNVHLNSPDESFMQFLPTFDAVVLSSGHWFTTECTYLLNSTTARRQLRRAKRSPKRSGKFDNLIKSYGLAIHTALNAIASVPNYRGLTIFRAYSPEHYSGGTWNMGGSCVGADSPASKSVRSAFANAMRKQQIAELERAAKGVGNGSKMRFMDITEMSGYRHDGHAGPYRSKVRTKGPEDCVHWCMPGPVDTWNEILFEILKREI